MAAVTVFISGDVAGNGTPKRLPSALIRSIDHGTRAFIVWLPGAEPRALPQPMPGWLRARPVPAHDALPTRVRR